MKYPLLWLMLLTGCYERGLDNQDIEWRCAQVGYKAHAEANDGTKDELRLKLIEQGAKAECEIKYLPHNLISRAGAK